ncbi:MAG TPA: TMEM175 family protein [Chitinophagaceae bacterium]|nr:TMEM175 family protein [Chitinophagaceae bacterium]
MEPLDEIKNEFMIERITFFSDAVFAIAMTLLIIDIRIPDFPGPITDSQFAHALVALIPKLFSFVVSFVTISSIWASHHKQFRHVLRYDHRLIRLNLFLLFFVVVIPFTTSLFGRFSYIPLAGFIYCMNIAIANLVLLFIWLYIANPKRNISNGLGNPALRRFIVVSSLIVPVVFTFTGLLCWIVRVGWQYFFLYTIFPLYSIVIRRYRRRYGEIKL